MNRELIVVLFRLFTIGMFVDGQGTISKVSVMERDSVTLKSGVTYIKTDDEIEWKFKTIKIATISKDSSRISAWVKPDGSFRDKLELDNQTGDLKISNIRTTDSALYKLEISSPDGSSEEEFTVNVVSADEVKSVTVMKGDSVTLLTGLTDIQRYGEIQWRFGQQKSPVAVIANSMTVYDNGLDGRFRDRLKLDEHTGSLTITNITTQHTGVYEVDINSSRYIIHKTVSMTVKDAAKPVAVKKGQSVTLQVVTEIQNDDQIHFMLGDTFIVQIHKKDDKLFMSDVLDERFRDRLELDHQTGSLIIINTRITDSGEYQLKISSRRRTINRRIFVTVSVPDPHPGPDPGSGLSAAAVAGIVVAGLLVAAFAVVGLIVYKKAGQSHPMEENGGNHKKQDTEEEIKLSDDS